MQGMDISKTKSYDKKGSKEISAVSSIWGREGMLATDH